MKISTIKLCIKYVTGGKTAVLDYVLDIANNAVNNLADASKDKIAEILAVTKKILELAQAISWMVKSDWRIAYGDTLMALTNVVNACEDLKITPEELTAVVTAWQVAYSSWRAE